MVTAVTVLPVIEAACFDTQSIHALGSQLGPLQAEEMICRALEDLAQKLGQFERAQRRQDHATLRKTAHAMAAVAGQIGMVGLVRVAGDVVYCADTGDITGLAATTARLIRVGEESLTAIWDVQTPAN